ncbi:MAG: hypothetical protein R3F56_24745 [Planctomycetota bacterium]
MPRPVRGRHAGGAVGEVGFLALRRRDRQPRQAAPSVLVDRTGAQMPTMVLPALLLAAAVAQSPLVHDVNPGLRTIETAERQHVTVGGSMFWIHNNILLVTDGTSAGSRMVRAFHGSLGSLRGTATLAFFFERVFTPSLDSRALWVSDGTLAGTTMLHPDVRPVLANLSAVDAVCAATLQNRLFFIGQDATFGKELWVSDGTVAGTHLFADIRPGAASAFGRLPSGAFTQFLYEAAGYLWFSAEDGVHGHELWRTDGTVAGTQMVDDLAAGAADAYPSEITPFGGGVLFAAIAGSVGIEPCISTGPGTTRLVHDVYPGGSSSPQGFVDVGGTVMFSAVSAAGRELWRTDGTSAGTQMVADIAPGTASSFPAGLVALGSQAIFLANDGTHGVELWASDGTAAGTQLLFDAIPGAESGAGNAITTWQGRAWLMGYHRSAANVREVGLISTDGTVAGSTLFPVAGFEAFSVVTARPMVTANGLVFLPFKNGIGDQPWVTGGTAVTTRQLATLVPEPNHDGLRVFISFGRVGMGTYRDELYFHGDNEAEGTELWATDGTSSGTRMVRSHASGPTDARLTPGQTLADRAYVYTAQNVGRGQTDPMAAPEDLPWTFVRWGEVVGDRLVLMVDEGVGQPCRLVSTDGTAAGTSTIRSGFPAFSSSEHAFLPDGRILFETSGELWTTDGTPAGTQLAVANAADGFAFRAAAGGVFFATGTGQLWFSDGSSATQVGSFSGLVSELVALNGLLYFSADDGSSGVELWISDGSAAGTHLLVDLEAGPAGSSPASFAVADDRLFFAATRSGEGRELWSSDGTAAGTSLVVDLNPGTESSQPTGLFAIGSRVVFSALTPAEGSETWVSDGTAAGTRPLVVLSPGPWGARTRMLAVVGDNLLFDGINPVAGHEVHKVALAVIGAAYADTFGMGGDGSAGRPAMFWPSLPRLGATTGAGVRRAPASTAAGLLLSAQRGRIPMGGECFLYLGSIDLVLPTSTDATGSALVSLPVPNLAELAGQQLFAQYLVADSGACFAGLVNFSDRLRLHLGR